LVKELGINLLLSLTKIEGVIMFGLGKTKIDRRVFCRDQWIKITSPERQSIWRAFIEECDDEELNKVDFEKFSNCMIGAYVQLLRLAVLKTQTNDTAFMFGVYLSEELETNQESHRFFEELNQSFGSDRDDGIRAMSNTVKILMKPADISPETVDKIHHEFLSLLFSMRDVLKKVKLTE